MSEAFFDPIRGTHPLARVEWIAHEKLLANSWNPNVVLGPELRLLEYNLLKHGWIQPVLVAKGSEEDPDQVGVYTIIDGFHRTTLVKASKKVAEMTGGRVPCAVLKLSVADRKMLTVRINRAKGTHQAFRMHDLVKSLVEDHGVAPAEIAKGIGATIHEVEVLLMEDVFQKLDIANHVYSKAWTPA